MNKQTQEFRQQIADMFIKTLEEKNLEWKRDWQLSGGLAPVNAITNKEYRGVNTFYLSFIAMGKGYKDNRWATFNQIKEKGWKLEKGAKGAKVEYWLPYDLKQKKNISWQEYENMIKQEKDEVVDVTFVAKYYTVFNATHIDGIEPLPKKEMEERNINSDEIIAKLSKNMGVEIKNDGGNQAFYRPSEDTIHLPKPETFFTDYGYNSTALHELAHSTGHASRLNRNIANSFGTPDYAYEELIAEISSCFMSANLHIPTDEHHVDNHKAYVQSWIQQIKEKPETLMKAIKEADKVADYMEEKAELKIEKEQAKPKAKAIEIDVKRVSDEVIVEPSPQEPMYQIFQMKDGEAYRNYRFQSSEILEKMNVAITQEHYNMVYEVAKQPTDTLESIYEKFNFNLPADFKGHSLSVSDVVVAKEAEKTQAFFVDRFGFKEIKGFLQKPEQSKLKAIQAIEPVSTKQVSQEVPARNKYEVEK